MRRLVISISILLLLVLFSPITTAAGAGEKQNMSLHQASAVADIDQLKLLISQGADVNAKDQYGLTPLHWAAGYGHKDIAELLLANNADVNIKDNKGRTALQVAQEHGKTQIVEMLLKHGAEEPTVAGTPGGISPLRPGPTETTGAEPIKADSSIYEQSLAAFIKEIDSTYPFFDLKGIRSDWSACKKELLEKIKQCRSNEQFYGLLNEARLCLRDSHLEFVNLKGQFPQDEVSYYPGLCFLPAADGQVVIMSCAPEYSGKLKPGTIVTEIDGQNAHDYLENDAKKSWKAGGSFSSPQRARLFSYRIPLKGKQNDNHQITIIKNGKTENISVVSKWEAKGWPHTYAEPEDLKQRGNCSYGKLKSGYGYIYLRRIAGELVAVIDEALNSFDDIRGLIIDLRGNGGGGYGTEVFTRFNKKQGPSTEAPFYQGDMVVLIDAGAISAGETFARDLVYSAGAYLMGSPTAGSSSAKRQWEIPNGLGTVTLPVRSRWGFEQQPIEYNGIAPNETVEVVPAELQNGINSGIKRAEEYLNKKWALKSAADRNLPLIVRKKEYPGQFERTQPIGTTYTTSTAEPDPIADPNEVKARVKAFEGLEKALTQVDRRSRYEEREWLQTRVDNRINLVKAVEMQVKAEISFMREVAAEEEAKKTTKAIDDLLLDRQERVKTLVKTMEEEIRKMRLPQRGSRRITGSTRSTLDPEERRRAWEERRSGRRLPGEDTTGQGGFTTAAVESPPGAPQTASAAVGGKNELQISEWLKTGVENRISLANAAQEPIKADLIHIRKFAVEEGAKKTTAAIDGLLLGRQQRTARLVQRMEEQLKRMRLIEQGTRKIRGPRRSILNPEQRRSGGLTPTQGTAGQPEAVEEENPPARQPRRR